MVTLGQYGVPMLGLDILAILTTMLQQLACEETKRLRRDYEEITKRLRREMVQWVDCEAAWIDWEGT
jgi:hypothetical protein